MGPYDMHSVGDLYAIKRSDEAAFFKLIADQSPVEALELFYLES